MDVHELIYAAKKLKRSGKARTLLGAPGTLSSRLQPNHPTDDLEAMTLLIYWGLSLGSGDALIGLNPAIDTVENISATLQHLDKLRRETGAPTQICVLAHIKTQLACLESGAPVEIMFQSLAGTERTLIENSTSPSICSITAIARWRSTGRSERTPSSSCTSRRVRAASSPTASTTAST